MNLELQPISWQEACDFINQHHRHHKAPQGWKFGIAVNDGNKIVGVITIGRPVSRIIQQKEPFTLEVTRCCTDGTKNAASKLYGAAWQAVKAMGYKRLITYTLASEPGTSLIATGFKEVYSTPGKTWSNATRHRVDKHPLGQKSLWEMI